MRIKRSVEEMIEEDALSIANALNITVADLKKRKVSLYDIVAANHNEETEKVFSSARSVFRAASFYLIKILLK